MIQALIDHKAFGILYIIFPFLLACGNLFLILQNGLAFWNRIFTRPLEYYKLFSFQGHLQSAKMNPPIHIRHLVKQIIKKESFKSV